MSNAQYCSFASMDLETVLGISRRKDGQDFVKSITYFECYLSVRFKQGSVKQRRDQGQATKIRSFCPLMKAYFQAVTLVLGVEFDGDINFII